MPTPFLINDTSPTIDDKQRDKVLKRWDDVDHCEIFRVVAGNAQRTRQGVKKEDADGIDDVLAKAYEYIDKHVDEHGPATYMVSFKNADGKVLGSIFTNAGMEEQATAETHHTQSIAAYARGFNSTLDAVSRREQVLTGSFEKVGAMLAIAADATAKAVDAQIRIAELRFEDSKDLRDREDRRAENSESMERLRMAMAFAEKVITPVAPAFASWVAAKAAEARAHAGGSAEEEDEPGEDEGESGEGDEEEAQDAQYREAQSAPSRDAQDAQPSPSAGGEQARGGESTAASEGDVHAPDAGVEPDSPPADPGEPARASAPRGRKGKKPPAAAPKRAAKRKRAADLSPLASQTAGLLERIKPAERERLIAAVGEDVWSCIEAAAKQTDDNAAVAIFRKMQALRKDMPQAARDRMTSELMDILGKLRGAEFYGILLQAGVN